MINIETLKKGPPKQREKPLPIISDDTVRENFRQKIEIIRKRVQKPIRIYPDYRSHHPLFYASAGEKYSAVYDSIHELKRGNIGRAKAARLQEIALDLMHQYGLNESVFTPANMQGLDENGIAWRHEGVAREFLDFPSQTIPGLVFRRNRDYYLNSGETILFGWEVVDESPQFRINLSEAIFPKKPQKVLPSI